MVAEVREQLIETLKKVDRPGKFCTRGRMPPLFPGLEVADLGTIGLPLEKRQAAALKKLARQAPYGKGTKTVVDTDVRRVWEIDAEQVSLANPDWTTALKCVVDTVQAELGLEKQKLHAHLYKLLLYEPGSFFLSHRDGEKLDRMVATLVIALPSAHKGGELVVGHEGQQEIVDFSPESSFQTQFAAFYADCEHEILPVTSGHRLALVYNLVLAKSPQTIKAPTSGAHIAAVARILQHWNDEGYQNAAPVVSGSRHPATKLAVVLDHQYTQSGLTFDALKGLDRAKAHVLFAAARQAGCDASLAIVTKWVSGSAEYGGGYGRSRGRWRYDYDDDERDHGGKSKHVMGEVFDESLIAEHFSDAEGNPLTFQRIPLQDDELVSLRALTDGEPDKEDYEGYTGNAGMTLERWYHRAAILLWPTASRFDVLCEAGVTAAVGGLEQMVQHWKQASKSKQRELLPPCLEFARRIIAHWPEQNYASGYYPKYGGDDAAGEGEYLQEDFDEEDDFFDEGEEQSAIDDNPRLQENPVRRSLLSLLAEIADISLISDWLRGVVGKDVSVDPGKTLGDLCQRYGWLTFQVELRELFDSTSNESLERHAWLLADWSLRTDNDADRRSLCSQLAQQFMLAMESWNPQQAKHDWRARIVKRRELLPPLIQALLALDEQNLLERLATYVLDRPKEFDLTTVQAPALLSLETWLKRKVKQASSPLYRWLTACDAQLESRVSDPPQKPADWRRNSNTGCKCEDCRQLSLFLQDPNTMTFRLTASEYRRQHLHQAIDRMKLDVTHVTERRGRPYTLVCTKTEASYEVALKAHQVDLEQLAKIRKLLAWHAELSNMTKRPPKIVPKATKKRRK